MEKKDGALKQPVGALKEAGSARAYYYTADISKIKDEDVPKSYRLPHPPKVLDQGSVNSCVAHGVAEAMSTALFNEYWKDIDLSVLLIYGLWRGDFTGEGMFPESTIDNGRKIGTAYRSFAPANVEVPEAIRAAKAAQEADPDALIFKVKQWFKIRINEEKAQNIKKALLEFCVPIVVVSESPSFRHCEIVIGWEEDGRFIVQNSYGETWGDNGYHRMKADKIEEAYIVLSEAVKTPFKDIDGHWAEGYIKNLYFAGIVSGMDETHFCPEAPLKRGEMCKLLDVVMKKQEEARRQDRELYEARIKALEEALKV